MNLTKKLAMFACTTEASEDSAVRRQTSREWVRQVEEPELEFDELGIELEAQDGEVLQICNSNKAHSGRKLLCCHLVLLCVLYI